MTALDWVVLSLLVIYCIFASIYIFFLIKILFKRKKNKKED